MSWFLVCRWRLSLVTPERLDCREGCDCVLWAVGLENGYSRISTGLGLYVRWSGQRLLNRMVSKILVGIS